MLLLLEVAAGEQWKSHLKIYSESIIRSNPFVAFELCFYYNSCTISVKNNNNKFINKNNINEMLIIIIFFIKNIILFVLNILIIIKSKWFNKMET